MAPILSPPKDRSVPIRGLSLHIQQWDGDGIPYILLHGLASNCLTWEAVARTLNAAGHPVVTVDQRGHGHSDKPEKGYSFEEVTSDLHALIACSALNGVRLSRDSPGAVT